MTVIEDYVTASEAARILGVSRQRVGAMVRDGEIEHVRPWPRQVLIRRSALREWQRGNRQQPIHKTACRHWIIEREGIQGLDTLNPQYLWNVVREFIDNHRPDWDETSKNNWTNGMHGLLMRRPGAPR